MDLAPHTPASSFFHVSERDLLAELLADKRSPNTRRAYERDLKDFFASISPQPLSPQLVAEFLKLERFTAIALVLKYKSEAISKGLAEATVNRRLAAIKSLVRFAQKQGRCQWSLEEVHGERVKPYRDTSGIGVEDYRRVLETCDRSTLAGKRNYAILRLLWENVLRRGEVSKLNVEDFGPEFRTLAILGKGRGTQRESVTLSPQAVEAISEWLHELDPRQASSPLFVALDNASHGKRLSGNAIYELVRAAAIRAGLSKRLSPHRCRHSGITAALDATGGDVRRVKKLSRHARTDTLMIYDDNRQNAQGQVSAILSEMIIFTS